MLDKHEPLKHNAFIMNRLSKEQRTNLIASLVEGNSLRATARILKTARAASALPPSPVDNQWEACILPYDPQEECLPCLTRISRAISSKAHWTCSF
jgi:hypothetical protein